MPVKNQEIFEEYKNKCGCKVFVETGSYMGGGIENAKKARFEKIYSIEISEKYFNICRKKFENDKTIDLINGDSALVLESVLSDASKYGKIMVWLDGHYSGGDTGKGMLWSPLIKELESISKINFEEFPVIIIDDMRCWNPLDENFNQYNFTEQDLKNEILKISEKYSFVYMDGYVDNGRILKNDILIAFVL